jgi:hypothetical protein
VPINRKNCDLNVEALFVKSLPKIFFAYTTLLLAARAFVDPITGESFHEFIKRFSKTLLNRARL